jgi:hypothetical protein
MLAAVGRVNRLCLPVLIILVAWVSWGHFGFRPPSVKPLRMEDYSLNVEAARRVCDEGRYPPNFVYPPATVLFWHAFDSLGSPAGFLLWLVVLPASLIGCLWLAARLARGTAGPGDGIVMAVAFAAVNHYLLWDLRTINVNSFYLLLVLLGAWCWRRKQPSLAGILFGASVAVKIYSVLLLLYVIFRRQWRIALAMAATIAVCFVVLPICCFGWHDALVLDRDWLQAIGATNRPEFLLNFYGYNVSLSWIALVLMNPAASQGKLNFVDWSPERIALLVKAACLVWGVLVAGYFASTWRRETEENRQPLALLLDLSLLLLCPLPASPFLQPHHPVPLLVPAVCLVWAALDAGFPTRVRLMAGGTVGLGFCLTRLGPGYPLRGVGVMLTLLAYLGGIWMLRLAASRRVAPGQARRVGRAERAPPPPVPLIPGGARDHASHGPRPTLPT